MIRIVVPGQPVAKGRPRVAVRNGRAMAYTPQKTATYENLIALVGQDVMEERELIEGPISVTVFAHFQMPKGWSKKRRLAALTSPEWHTSRPDGDNVLKCAGDALNGVVWRDDSQIASAQVVKTYAETPQLVIEVKSL